MQEQATLRPIPPDYTNIDLLLASAPGETCRLPTFREQIASHLTLIRGNRLLSCMTMWQWFSHDNHQWCRPLSACDLQHCCMHCAKHQAMELYHRYRELKHHITSTGFTHLTFENLDLTSPKDMMHEIVEVMRREMGYKVPILLAMKAAHSAIEVLCCQPVPEYNIACLKKQYNLRATLKESWQLDTTLKTVLAPGALRHPLPQDANTDEAADLAKTIGDIDARFTGVHLVRFIGLTQEERKKFSTSIKPAPVDNFHVNNDHKCSECDGPTLKAIPRCPYCTKPATKFSKWGYDCEPPTDPAAWTDVIPWDGQPHNHPRE